MKILIKALAKSPGNKWQVRLDGDAFTFRTEAEARAEQAEATALARSTAAAAATTAASDAVGSVTHSPSNRARTPSTMRASGWMT